jgi:regulator of replication initiation timing
MANPDANSVSKQAILMKILGLEQKVERFSSNEIKQDAVIEHLQGRKVALAEENSRLSMEIDELEAWVDDSERVRNPVEDEEEEDRWSDN